MTKIEWTEKTWNPIAGCSLVSPGCTNCYAMRMAARLEAMNDGHAKAGNHRNVLPHYNGLTKIVNGNPVWSGRVAWAGERALLEPLRRKKPTMYFVNSMSDLFHDDVPDEWIDRVFAVMALCPQHTFQVLTKRSARMRAYFDGDPVCRWVDCDTWKAGGPHWDRADVIDRTNNIVFGDLRVPPNVWLGVSCEDQRRANERIPDLLATPAAVRFISAEPLLGPIDFTFVGNAAAEPGNVRHNALTGHALPFDGFIRGAGIWATNKATKTAGLDWIIIGGESGPGARPMHPDWARAIRDQCKGLNYARHSLGLPDVPFFFKQWGHWKPLDQIADKHITGTTGTHGVIHIDGRFQFDHDIADPPRAVFTFPFGKSRAGRLLDGRTWDEMPATLQRATATEAA